jgi:hypothetical protein
MGIGWLTCIPVVFAPACGRQARISFADLRFTLSFHDSECSRKPPNAHSLGRYGQVQKKKTDMHLRE